MTPTPGPVPDLFPGAPQRVAGLDLHAIAGRPSTTPLLRSYADVPPRARSAPRGAMTLALAPTLARHAEHAPTAGHNQPRHVYAEPVQPCALAMTDALSFHFPAIPTASRNGKPETHRFSCSRAHQLARSCSSSLKPTERRWCSTTGKISRPGRSPRRSGSPRPPRCNGCRAVVRCSGTKSSGSSRVRYVARAPGAVLTAAILAAVAATATETASAATGTAATALPGGGVSRRMIWKTGLTFVRLKVLGVLGAPIAMLVRRRRESRAEHPVPATAAAPTSPPATSSAAGLGDAASTSSGSPPQAHAPLLSSY
jgi:hypothetical protein